MGVLRRRVHRQRDEELDEIQLQGDVVDAHALPRLHGDVERVVALGIYQLLDVVRRTRFDKGLAGLDVGALDGVEKGLVALGREIGLIVRLQEGERHADRGLSGLCVGTGIWGYEGGNAVIGAVLNEQREQVPVVEDCRPVQCCAPKSVLLIDIKAALQQLHDNLYTS